MCACVCMCMCVCCCNSTNNATSLPYVYDKAVLLPTLVPVYPLTFKCLKELLVLWSFCSTSCFSLLDKGTNCSVVCFSSQARKGKRWEKGTEGDFSHGGKGWLSWALSLILPLPLFAIQERKFISLAFLSQEVGKYMVNATSFELGPQSLDLSRN